MSNEEPEKTTTSGLQSTSIQPQMKCDLKHSKQSLVTNALVNFVTDDLVPISVVDSNRFKTLLGTLDPQYQLPSVEHFSTVLLKEKYESLKRNLCNQLKNATAINLTIDIWSNHSNRSQLSLTGHYISDQWSLESVVLGCSQVTGRLTADHLKAWYERVVSDFNLSDKVKHIITDCRSNTAFLTLPGYEDVQDINIMSDEGLEKQDCHFLECDKIFEHHTCFEYMLELVVKDGMKAADQHISAVIEKCSSLIPFIKDATDVFKEECTLHGGKFAKWSSQLKILRLLLSISESALAQVENALRLTSDDRILLHNFVEILTPFEEAADFIQASCSPTIGYVIPCIYGLHHHMRGIVTKQQCTVLATSLQQSLKKRMLYYEQNETYILAAILDPRFKLCWCSDSDNKQKSVGVLKSALNRMIPHPSRTDTADDKGEPQPNNKKPFLNFMSFMYDEEYLLSQSQPIDLVDDYIEATTMPLFTDPTKFWRDNEEKYPLLSRLAKDVLAVATSSSPVDKLISMRGKVFTPETCWLDDETFRQSMFIRCNNVYTHSIRSTHPLN